MVNDTFEKSRTNLLFEDNKHTNTKLYVYYFWEIMCFCSMSTDLLKVHFLAL